MTEVKDIQNQIDQINHKLDYILEYIRNRELKEEENKDLWSDINIIGKEVYKAAVEELDHQGIYLDMEEIKLLFFQFLKNIENIKNALNLLENLNDLLNDMKYISRDFMLNAIHKLGELEEKGYIDFAREGVQIIDNIVNNFTPEDVRALADNIVLILNTIKELTQPDMLAAINNAVTIYKYLDTKDVEPISLWKAMRELNSPEMRKGLGFIITFLKSIQNEQLNK